MPIISDNGYYANTVFLEMVDDMGDGRGLFTLPVEWRQPIEFTFPDPIYVLRITGAAEGDAQWRLEEFSDDDWGVISQGVVLARAVDVLELSAVIVPSGRLRMSATRWGVKLEVNPSDLTPKEFEWSRTDAFRRQSPRAFIMANGKPQMVIGDDGRGYLQWPPGVKTYTETFIGGADLQHDVLVNGEAGLANFVAGIRNTWAAGRIPVLSGLSVFFPDAPPVEPAIPLPTAVVKGTSSDR